MRYVRLAILLLGFLAFLATAAPISDPTSSVENIEEEKRSSDTIVYERDLPTRAYQVDTVCPSDYDNCSEDDKAILNDRGLLSSSSSDKKKDKKKPASTPKASAPKKTPKPVAAPKKTPKPVAAPKKTPAATPAGPTKSKDYLVVEAAAKKKGAKIEVGKAYLLTEMSSATISHHKLVMAKIVKNGNELGVQGTMTQLVLAKDQRGKCFENFGGLCEDKPLENYSCGARVESGKGKFVFSGTAKPEFGDPKTFKTKGHELLIKDTKYNIFTNNCQIFASNLANISRQ